MDSPLSYYNILRISEDSSMQEIKSAFRRLSLTHHPDRNGNSAESHTAFIILSNAYDTLIDPVRRGEYDAYLKKSAAFKNRKNTPPGKGNRLSAGTESFSRFCETILKQFNFLLWDIDDLIRTGEQALRGPRDRGSSLYLHTLKILVFMDKWVLHAAGFKDFFMEARGMNGLDPADYIPLLSAGASTAGHRPFAGLQDYFYDIRKRADKFLKKVSPTELAAYLPNRDIRLIDSVIEAENYTVHYLSYLLRIKSGEELDVPPFSYTRPFFRL